MKYDWPMFYNKEKRERERDREGRRENKDKP